MDNGLNTTFLESVNSFYKKGLSHVKSNDEVINKIRIMAHPDRENNSNTKILNNKETEMER